MKTTRKKRLEVLLVYIMTLAMLLGVAAPLLTAASSNTTAMQSNEIVHQVQFRDLEGNIFATQNVANDGYATSVDIANSDAGVPVGFQFSHWYVEQDLDRDSQDEP